MSDHLLVDTVINVARPTSLLEMKIDANAERYIVLDRRSFQMLTAGVRPPSGVVKTLLPQEFSTAAYCMVGIVDDNGEYNCKFVDGVQLQLIDANTYDMSQ